MDFLNSFEEETRYLDPTVGKLCQEPDLQQQVGPPGGDGAFAWRVMHGGRVKSSTELSQSNGGILTELECKTLATAEGLTYAGAPSCRTPGCAPKGCFRDVGGGDVIRYAPDSRHNGRCTKKRPCYVKVLNKAQCVSSCSQVTGANRCTHVWYQENADGTAKSCAMALFGIGLEGCVVDDSGDDTTLL